MNGNVRAPRDAQSAPLIWKLMLLCRQDALSLSDAGRAQAGVGRAGKDAHAGTAAAQDQALPVNVVVAVVGIRIIQQ